MAIHAYTTLPTTTVALYGTNTLLSQPELPGHLRQPLPPQPRRIHSPGLALHQLPGTYNDVNIGTGRGATYAVIKADQTVLWEFGSQINNTPSTDRQTFLASNNATNLGAQFYFWLSTGTNNNYADGHGFGDAVAIFN